MTTIDLRFDDDAFSGQVPLFPLPGVVLLPGGLLPLHVFEPRYRAMVRDALAGERLVAMALLEPAQEQGENDDGVPAIASHVCIGRITLEQRLDDGRYTFVLVGLRRARILSEDRSRPYRLAQVELLLDPPVDPQAQIQELDRLGGALANLPRSLVRDSSRLGVVLQLLDSRAASPLGLGAAIDLIADALLLGLQDRLLLLGTPGASERATVLLQLVERRRTELAQLKRPRSWPPPFSQN